MLQSEGRRRPEEIKNLLLRNAAGELMPLGELAWVGIASGRGTILHDGARRGQVVTCNVQHRDLASFVAEVEHKVSSQISSAPGVYLEFSGAAEARAQSQREIKLNSLIAAVIIVCLLYIAFGNVRNLLLVLVNVPFALVGGVLAALLTGGELSLG